MSLISLVAPCMLRNSVVGFAFLLLTSVAVTAQNDSNKKVRLEGQFVCSECWFEVDRKTTAYGTAADIQCAQDCGVKGVPPAVAVKTGDDFKLYLIEPGQFKKNSEEWLAYMLLILFIPLLVSAQSAGQSDVWLPFNYFLGTWKGISSYFSRPRSFLRVWLEPSSSACLPLSFTCV